MVHMVQLVHRVQLVYIQCIWYIWYIWYTWYIWYSCYIYSTAGTTGKYGTDRTCYGTADWYSSDKSTAGIYMIATAGSYIWSGRAV